MTDIEPTEPPELFDDDDASPKVEKGKWTNSPFRAALLGGLVASLIGAVVTVWTTTYQSHSEASRARSEFLRTQRQNAYADFLASTGDLERTTFAYVQRFSELGSDITRPALKDAFDAVTAAHLKAAGDEANVLIIASADVAALADAAFDGYDLTYKSIELADLALATLSPPALPDLFALGLHLTGSSQAWRSKFINAARRELGISGKLPEYVFPTTTALAPDTFPTVRLNTTVPATTTTVP